jgi:molybdate transport system ATP-binding protein
MYDSSIVAMNFRSDLRAASVTLALKLPCLELLTDRVRVQVDASPPALVDISAAAVADLALRPGTGVWLSAKAT